MKKAITGGRRFVGLDVHAETNRGGDGRKGRVVPCVVIAPTEPEISKHSTEGDYGQPLGLNRNTGTFLSSFDKAPVLL